MDSHIFSRRSFIQQSTIVGLGTPFIKRNIFLNSTNTKMSSIPIRWIDTVPTGFNYGSTFGLPWKKGEVKNVSNIFFTDNKSKPLEVQSWVLAYWPDGTLKWTAHAIMSNAEIKDGIVAQTSNTNTHSKKAGIQLTETLTTITIDTGALVCVFNKTGDIIVQSLEKDQDLIATSGVLVLQNKEQTGIVSYRGNIENVFIEQEGPIRTVIKVVGKHCANGRSWLPFILRFYFYKQSDAIKILHTIFYDGDENKDFINGLGLQFDLSLQEALYNRHVKFVDQKSEGVFSEFVQNLTGLRRDPGEVARTKQIDGVKVDASDISDPVKQGLKYIPSWGDFILSQPLPDGYSIKKRTSGGHSWLNCHYGCKSYGVAFVGDTNHGIVFGIRNFRNSFPASISLEKLHTNSGKLNMWLWSPDAESMDLRFYHNGLGEDTFEKQRDALDITYEDYEPGFGRPIGVARTSELWLKLEKDVPGDQQLVDYAKQIQSPLQLIASSDALQKASAFGNNWSVSSQKNTHLIIEKRLDHFFDFYKGEIERRKWLGYWNFGDVMHTYDDDRHNWRYDTGGFAWDNSELSSDLWLWYYFLRTGRSDVFRVAEAMTRHTGEVDVHHIGPFAPLGSRHNVMHWGDSAKQLRISTVTNRRFLYYLTADERIGELMSEQVEAYKTLQKIAPGRKLPKGSLQQENQDKQYVNMGFGTDWGSVAAAWFTEWERTRNSKWLTLLKNSMRTIAHQPKGFFTGGAPMNVDTGAFQISKSDKVSVSHLNAVFGLPEILTEINASVDDPVFFNAWLVYCKLYNASPEDQVKILGEPLKKLNLQQGHARLTAYAAWIEKDPILLQLAWSKFNEGKGGFKTFPETVTIKTPNLVQAVTEIPGVSTNAVAQWGLAAIQCIAYDF